jgi:lipoprotein-anchoring transpeptidase ErfK/SrfK
MKNIDIKRLFKSKIPGNITILIASIVLVYLLISIYFSNHFFFNTVINGADVSLKSHAAAEEIVRSYIEDYKLQLIERSGQTEEIIGQDIGIQFNKNANLSKTYHQQSSFKWISSLFRDQKYYVDDLIVFNKDILVGKINQLICVNAVMVEPQNVSFNYSNGAYEVIAEEYGNKIIREKLNEAIEMSVLKGETKLDLNEKHCYENPKYTLSSAKTAETKNLLNKYVKSNITYMFGSKNEMLDANIIHEWLCVDDNLDVVINEIEAMKFVRGLSKKYDTVGITRNFKTSLGKVVEVKGGIYGWKIDRDAETKALIENIKHGEVLLKEPIYSQKSLYREGDEIGDTYVEINITRQHLWFYKDGKLIAQGAVVTGNPNRGFDTVVGTYMLNYKQKGAILRGPGYEAEITYWMPFFGNIGIHDATWRHSFGGEIYKRRGSHGCVNAPFYLAKTIFENIDDGTPIISYEEL